MSGWVSILFFSCLAVTGISSRSLQPGFESSSWNENLVVRKSFLLNRTKCYDELGCFSTGGDFFDIIHRPINILPDDRDVINTQFRLYTRKTPTLEHVMRTKNKESLKTKIFDPSRKTKLVIHGLLDQLDFELVPGWMKKMKDALLAHGDYNVIIVDWSGGNMFPYSRAVANSRVVGAEVALLLKHLQDIRGLNMSDVHIIGHSLGAHSGGYAGERLTKLGRITGLDPAGPFFEKMPPIVRLDPTDALFVDVIHSDTDSLLGFGIRGASGHLDFYPNDGVKQPGCESTSRLKSIFDVGIIEGGKRFVVCDHQRAIELFQSSLNLTSSCRLIGRKCKDWEMYEAGRCNDCGAKGENCAYLGIDARPLPMKEPSETQTLFLKTSGKQPFCLFTYQVFVVMSDESDGKSKDERGIIYVTLHSKNGNSLKFEITNGAELIYSGGIFTKEVFAEEALDKVPFVTFRWEHKSQWILPSTWSLFRKPTLSVRYIKIVPMYTIDSKEIKAGTRLFCGNTKAIQSGEDVSYVAKASCHEEEENEP